MLSTEDLEKIRTFIDKEEYSKETFISDTLFYCDWEGNCDNCNQYVTDEDECMVISRKDIENLSGPDKLYTHLKYLLFCYKCYKILLEKLFN